MTNKEFLHWIADRLVHIHGENPHVDFLLKLREIANEQEKTPMTKTLYLNVWKNPGEPSYWVAVHDSEAEALLARGSKGLVQCAVRIDFEDSDL